MLRMITVLVLLSLIPASATAQSNRKNATTRGLAGNAAGVTSGGGFRDCPDCPEMVVVPAGEFLMGSPESERGRGKDEGPQHRVVFAQPFAIAKFELTFAQWDVCVARGGCAHKPDDLGWGRGKRPVINVSWDDAIAYVTWLTGSTGKAYRLPTEAQWEYAARGVTKISDPITPFSTGATLNYKQANYDANFIYGAGKPGVYRQRTVDVGSFPRNAFGLHDMHGNAWEWVQDCYVPNYSDATADGSPVTAADCPFRILRGGAWNYHPRFARSAYRYASPGDVRLDNAGFRVARSL